MSHTPFAALREDFIASLMFERALANNTCAAYAVDLRIFSEWLAAAGVTEIKAVTREHIAGFLSAEREKGWRGATRKRRTAAIRMWFRWLKATREVKHDPSELLNSPRKELTLPKTLSEAEVAAMIERIATSSPRDLRDRALLELMYGCGLRVSEACSIELDDFMAEGEVLRILGKGSKERIVPIGHAAGQAVCEYLAKARETFAQGRLSESHLFLTRLGKPFTRQGVFKVIRERAAAVGIAAERISPHVLRHCYATHMLAHGADIRVIQDLLGHADIGTTQIYTHVDTARFAEIHRQYHPRA